MLPAALSRIGRRPIARPERKKYQRNMLIEGLERREVLSISATDDAFVTNGVLSGKNVRTNDVGGTGSFLWSPPSHGSLTGALQTSGAFTYTPTGGFTGVDSFDYLLVDADETRKGVTGAAVSDRVGHAVDISGEFAVVGANLDDQQGADAGAAYVFRWDGSDWVQMQKLLPDATSAGGNFGNSVAIDGSRIVIGAPYDDDGVNNSGSIYVFTYNGLNWYDATTNPTQKITQVSPSAEDWFGNSVDISGNQIVAGTPYDDDAGTNSGSVQVYNFNSTAQTWQAGQKLTVASTPFDAAGNSVAIDGNRIVAGANIDDEAGQADAGSAYIWDNIGGTWTYQTRLVGGTTGDAVAANDQFGWSVDVDGDRVIVGSKLDDYSSITDAGSAFLFEKVGGSWNKTVIRPNDPQANAWFGWSVGLDGNTAVSGAYRYDQGGTTDFGAVYVYEKIGNDWPQVHKLLTEVVEASALNGYAVAAIDGDLIISGLPAADAGAFNSGAVAFYHLYRDLGTATINVVSGSTTVRAADDRFTVTEDTVNYAGNVLSNDLGATGAYLSRKPTVGTVGSFASNGAFQYTPTTSTVGTDSFTYTLTDLVEKKKNAGASAQNQAYFGRAVALDGDTAVVGAPYEDIGGATDKGAVYILQWNGQDWIEVQKIEGEAAGSLFGYEVAIHQDRIIVGAWGLDVGANVDQGAAYIFEYNGTSWGTIASGGVKFTGEGASDWFGRSVAIYGDTAVFGAPYNDHSSKVNAGAAYVSNFNGGAWSTLQKVTASGGDSSAGDQFGVAVGLDNKRMIVGANTDDEVAANTGSAFIFENSSGTWMQQAKLLAGDWAAEDQFGFSVAISGDVAAIGAYRANISGLNDAGAAYVFKFNGSAWAEDQKVSDPNPETDDYFGFDVAVDGDTFVVGAYAEDIGSTNVGAAHIYRDDGTDWILRHSIVPSTTVYGSSLGFSAGAIWGDNILLGIPSDTVGGVTIAGSVGFYEFQNASVLLSVVPGANDAPTISTTIPDMSGISEDSQDVVIQLNKHFTDHDLAAGDTLAYSVTANSNPTAIGATIVGHALVLDFKDNQAGAATITVRATDAAGQFTSDTFSVTSTGVGDPPSVDWLKDSPSVIRRGQSLTLEAAVSDPEGSITSVNFYRDLNGNQILETSIDQSLGSDTTATNGVYSVAFNGTTNFEDGRQTYFATVTAGGQTSAPIMSIGEVYNANGAPTLEPIGTLFVVDNTTEHFRLRATDPEAQVLAYTLTGPSGGTAPTVSVNSSTGVLTVNAGGSTAVGTYNYQTAVSDGANTTRQNFIVKIGSPDQYAPYWAGNEVPDSYSPPLSVSGEGSRRIIWARPAPTTPPAANQYTIDFTMWFVDQDSPRDDISISALEFDLPSGLGWSIVDDDVNSYRGVRVSGEISHTSLSPTAYNMLFQVSDREGNVSNEDFYSEFALGSTMRIILPWPVGKRRLPFATSTK